jgi:hypothetical protein
MSKPIEFSVKFVLHTQVRKLATSQWTETHPYKLITGVLISGRPVAHGNQNVTWATWKRRKIAQQLCIPKLSFVRLYRDRFSVTCSTEMSNSKEHRLWLFEQGTRMRSL